MGSKSIIDLAIFDLGGTVCDGIDEATGLANIGPINALKFSLKFGTSIQAMTLFFRTWRHVNLTTCLRFFRPPPSRRSSLRNMVARRPVKMLRRPLIRPSSVFSKLMKCLVVPSLSLALSTCSKAFAPRTFK